MEVMNMKNTNFSLLDQLELPSYERRFEDINLNYVFSNEEVETYSVKKITSLAIMSDMELPSTIPAYNHLNIIMVSLNKDVKFNKYFFDMYKKVTEYCGSLCIIVFEKNGALKFGTCDEINFFNKTPSFGDIAFTQWIYEDYITPKIQSFFSEISTFLNSEELLFPDIEKFIFYTINNIKAIFCSEDQVKEGLKKRAKKFNTPLFFDYVLSTSSSTYCDSKGAPELQYELSSVYRACKQFAA